MMELYRLLIGCEGYEGSQSVKNRCIVLAVQREGLVRIHLRKNESWLHTWGRDTHGLLGSHATNRLSTDSIFKFEPIGRHTQNLIWYVMFDCWRYQNRRRSKRSSIMLPSTAHCSFLKSGAASLSTWYNFDYLPPPRSFCTIAVMRQQRNVTNVLVEDGTPNLNHPTYVVSRWNRDTYIYRYIYLDIWKSESVRKGIQVI